MGKKILITGASGFIGSALTKKLAELGNEIYVIDNLSFGNVNLITSYISQLHQVDIRDRLGVEKAIKEIQPEIVIHLAAIHFIPYCNAHPVEAAEVNINGTVNLMDIIAETKSVQSVLFASTAAVYPILDTALNEYINPGPMDIYGTSKLAGERILEAFASRTNIKTTVCRFFNAFGPNETNPHVIPEIEQQLKNGSRTLQLGNIDPKRDFIHTYDMANAVWSLINRKSNHYDIFNLGRGIEYSIREIVDTFSKEIGEEIKIEIDPKRVRKVERMHLLADVSKIKKETGWQPEWSLEQGIKNLMLS